MTLYLRPPGRSGEFARSASSRKLERGDDFQIEKTRLEFRNEQISDHTLGRSSMNLLAKVESLAWSYDNGRTCSKVRREML